MAKDVFHQQVKNALIKDGWNITHDPLTIRIGEAVKLQIDLAAEIAIAAERDAEKIAVEIKSFIGDSDISTFHTALGQYLNYCQALEELEPERIVYLAIPYETYQDFFQLSFIQRALRRYQVKLMIYDPKLEEIRQWIK
ncbi:MAG: fatty-acid oxidation protein subunit alpha [Moorea sp. SIO1F2]|uniref:XisH family protein n=1 Tax=unclassified Moorena TaxID=2683338 RepID=UPI0013BCB40D|nr:MULTISPECIES: XisH family protein [unclassified Moorena]NEN98914.1 fatty-acid oxidation protein subunit alpha [Moorena sp. SIO3I7]NEO05046.1 fatty-acid oxidation protein subunit alpha [Moorena sp. SIO3I8]NEO18323.1 fatty-acid oxidation protein subunit alpha [Moorena sp. SIO4A5]NEP24205.1 fatty-acid oxidation protein subunit alpha [Moorena sp. SIO3I6]NEQ62068.1 fatty-acid oxidation protein subunit alpha [Moorena sp. SIO4A1]